MESFNPAFEYISPGVELQTHLGKFVLTHYNTRIREFMPPNEIYNHIEFEYIDENSERKVMGINPDAEIMKVFKDKCFPRLMMPYVDEHTTNWIIKVESNDLETAETVEDFTHEDGTNPDDAA